MIWFVLTSVELKFGLATGAPDAVNGVVFRLVAWRDLVGVEPPVLADARVQLTATDVQLVGLICPPNIQPSVLLLICAEGPLVQVQLQQVESSCGSGRR